jgi:hypothetical protein
METVSKYGTRICVVGYVSVVWRLLLRETPTGYLHIIIGDDACCSSRSIISLGLLDLPTYSYQILVRVATSFCYQRSLDPSAKPSEYEYGTYSVELCLKVASPRSFLDTSFFHGDVSSTDLNIPGTGAFPGRKHKAAVVTPYFCHGGIGTVHGDGKVLNTGV